MIEPVLAPLARAPWGVAALLVATADILAARFGAVSVRGEISGFSRAGSGHCYFSLKDSDGASALLRCAMFRRAATLVDFTPADGHQVELRGRLGVYEARGELQLIVESMQRVGAGALYEEFLRRRARLEAEGLFDAARKRAIPAHPRGLAVVTSLGAAALRDVLTSLQRRSPQVSVVIVPSLVQGADAPAALAAALQAAGRLDGIDTVLLVRGGGRGRAQVGGQIGQGDVGLVSDATHHRQGARGHRAHHALVVEGPEVLQRAATAHQQHGIDAVEPARSLQGRCQRCGRIDALHQAGDDHHAHVG